MRMIVYADATFCPFRPQRNSWTSKEKPGSFPPGFHYQELAEIRSCAERER